MLPVDPNNRRQAKAAEAYRLSQYEAWDMLGGRRQPELGGAEKYLDIIGVNFYHDNQWEHPGGEKIHWHINPRDPRWVPFNSLLADAYERYRLPIFIAETSHVGVGRAEWIRELTGEKKLPNEPEAWQRWLKKNEPALAKQAEKNKAAALAEFKEE